MYYLNRNPSIKPEKGKVLLAEPFLEDPFFKRTVILLCEHNVEGSFGFVLNNYIDVKLEQVMADMPMEIGRVSLGGPVKRNNLFYLHTLGNSIKNSVEVLEGIYLGGDFDALKLLLDQGKVKKQELRFFVGYSGWSAKQLEEEMEQNSWFVTDIAPDILMNTEIEDLWKTILSSMGKKGEIISNLPEDPSLN